MLLAMRREGALKVGWGPDFPFASLIPNNEVKCRLILNLVRMNRDGEMRPPKFKLPQIEELRSWSGGLPPNAKLLFVKIDLQNAYWSVVLPRRWWQLFVVCGMAVRRLPFGWAFLPAIFQELATRLVKNRLWGRGALPKSLCSMPPLFPCIPHFHLHTALSATFL